MKEFPISRNYPYERIPHIKELPIYEGITHTRKCSRQ